MNRGQTDFPLPAGIHLWIAFTGRFTKEQLQLCHSCLSPDEQDQADQFFFERDRAGYVIAHVLLRAALSSVSGCDVRGPVFQKGRWGRPSVKSPATATPFSFSLSHTDGCVGVALTTAGPVGLDIESLDRQIEPLWTVAAHTLTDAELGSLAMLEAGPMRERFLSLWTLKECYLKARGTGLSTDPTSFSFRLVAEHAPVFDPPPDDAQAWDFHLLTARSPYVISVCSPSPRQALYLYDGAELLSNQPSMKAVDRTVD